MPAIQAMFALLVAVAPASGRDSVPRYNIVATLAPDGAIRSRAEIRLPAPGRVRLQFRGLRNARVTDPDDRPLQLTWQDDSTEATVVAPAAIVVQYTLIPDSVRYRQFGYHLFESTGPSDAWYPIVAGYRFADFEVQLKAPPRHTVLTTGGVGNRFAVTGVEGFALAYGPDVVTRSLTRAGLRVIVLSPPRDTAQFRAVGEATLRAAEWYQETYGFFPVKSIGIVPGYQGARGGYPLPNVFMIHRGDLSPAFVRWITSHELAHYYWGLYVLDTDERLGWLSLALGIWTDQLYLARTSGRSLAASWRDPQGDDSFNAFAQAALANFDQRLGLPAATVDSLAYDYNSLIRHGKAATGLYLLSLLLGPDRFLALQRRLLAGYRERPLSVAAFGAELEKEGLTDAREFLARWVKGDASLGYRIAGVDSVDPTHYRIRIRRTGTIPFPVTIEAHSPAGRSARATLPGRNDVDSTVVELDGAPARILIDPAGELPMWSSDHPEMRRVFVRALGAVGPTETFRLVAGEHLRLDPDPLIAALLIERLFEAGRYREVLDLSGGHPAVTACTDRQTCLAALQVARSLLRTGDRAGAERLLRSLEPGIPLYGRTAFNRAQALRSELRGSP